MEVVAWRRCGALKDDAESGERVPTPFSEAPSAQVNNQNLRATINHNNIIVCPCTITAAAAATIKEPETAMNRLIDVKFFGFIYDMTEASCIPSLNKMLGCQ